MSAASIAALVILVATYVGVAAGGVPGLRLDRPGIAFLGGASMIALGPLSLDEAFAAIDLHTIALLVGMMIVVAHLEVSGAFRALGGLAIEHAHAPFVLLVTVTVLAGVLSAFLVNDAICLVMTPIVMQVVRALGRNPVPYLVATATASNCGSVATITGNPQNMVIGAVSKIPYPAFSAALSPVAAFGLFAVVVVVWLLFREEFARDGGLAAHLKPGSHPPRTGAQGEPRLRRARHRLLRRRAALRGRSPRRGDPALHPPDQALSDLSRDRRRAAPSCSRGSSSLWQAPSGALDPGASRHGEEPQPRRALAPVAVHDGPVQPRQQRAGRAHPQALHSSARDPQRAWLVVAMASTLAGNLTLIGSVANLIVAERARVEGTPISFWAYFKVGLPFTFGDTGRGDGVADMAVTGGCACAMVIASGVARGGRRPRSSGALSGGGSGAEPRPGPSAWVVLRRGGGAG